MSFRQYGGTNYASKNNIVKNNYTNSSTLSVTSTIGQTNGVVNSNSDISIHGNLVVSKNLTVSSILTQNVAPVYTFNSTISSNTNYSNYTSSSQFKGIYFVSTPTPITIILPSPTITFGGIIINFRKKANSSNNSITFTTTGTNQMIDYNSTTPTQTILMTTQQYWSTLMCDGSYWYLLSF